MREIKFRARHKESGTWDYGSSETKLEDCSSVPLRTFWEWVQIGKLDPETVGEFPGPKDKNGKEIYEGDRVKRHNGEIGSVEYQGVSFVLKRQGNWRDWEYIAWPTEFYEDCEVIGNIYENPELLKEEC